MKSFYLFFMVTTTIKTGVDSLVDLISQKKKISINEASKILGVSKELIEEWADFLEERGVITLEYRFTTPYLVYKEVTDKVVKTSKKEFETKKQVLTRQIDSTLQVIESNAAGLEKIKDEFDKINAELEGRIKGIKAELKELEKFDSLKRDLGRELNASYEEFKNKIKKIEDRISQLSVKYDKMVSSLEKEEEKLQEHYDKLLKLKDLEKNLKGNLENIKQIIKEHEKKEKEEFRQIALEEKKIALLKLQSKRLKAELKKHKEELKPLLKEFEDARKKSEKAKENVLKGFEEHLKSISLKETTVKNVKDKFEEYLKKKINIDILMDKINTDIEKLKVDLKALKQEAKLLKSLKDKDADKEVKKIEDQLKKTLVRKKEFEKKLEKLKKMILK